MATDIARLSFDPARHYTGVAAQQGRVTLEAEQNEQRIIDAEERRLELIDIIGPAGTPDNGYAIVAATGFDFTIGAGTMYVGGLRVALDHDILYSEQPDWLDHAGDPDWIAPDGKAGLHEHIVLVVQERDVTAVEDPVLREAALGGPDGSARTVLLQHVEQKPTEVRDCFKALPEAEHTWASQGLIFDEATLQLRSESRLLVTWEGIAEPPDPCEPASTGGYLGAENQLIRVQVTAVDKVKGTFDLLWGWDNASFLYRVTADASTNPVLTLDRSPADDYHRPRAGQAVQVLRAAADLRSTDCRSRGIRRGPARRGRRAHGPLRPGHQDRPVPGRPARLLHRPEADTAAVPASVGGTADRQHRRDADHAHRHRGPGHHQPRRPRTRARRRLLVHRRPAEHLDRGVPRAVPAHPPATGRPPAVGLPASGDHLAI